ncbi:MAG TPA: Ig-like domain-containing protein, partial [Longimicrobiales bacterium]|nr:Ig-like domain-containing protein [Longimicrobiales bacterium]
SSNAATGSVSDVTVDARATFSAHRAGQVTITAQAGIRTAQALVTVKNPVVVTNIYVENRAIWAGQNYKLHVTVMATGGTPAVAWSIEDPTIAEIDALGVVRGIRPGTTRAIATSGGKVGYGTVKVYANISGETVLQLQPGMDLGGYPRVVIEIGTTTWTDANGVQHPAKQWLWAGSITLHRGTENTYEQRLEIHTVVPVAGSHTQVVAVDTLIDRGIVWYDLIQAYKHYLVSTTNPGRQLTAQFFQAGRMIVWQQIGTAPLLDYVYDIKQ